MATNKNALIRYKVLDNCFRNPGKRYFIDDLIEECEKVLLEIDPDSNGISRRQILDDISFMESKDGWKIELTRSRVGRKVFYRYSDPAFSINNMPLNEVEINQLQSAADILSQFKGLLLVDNLETVDDPLLVSFLESLPLPTRAIVTSSPTCTSKTSILNGTAFAAWRYGRAGLLRWKNLAPGLVITLFAATLE